MASKNNRFQEPSGLPQSIRQVIDMFVDNQPEDFEKNFFTAVLKDRDTYDKVAGVLCVDQNTGAEIEDFTLPNLNAIFLAVKNYRQLLIPVIGGEFLPTPKMLEHLLHNLASTGKFITEPDIPDAIADYEAMVEADQDAGLLQLVTEGWPRWLSKLRALREARGMMVRSDWSAEDLLAAVQKSTTAIHAGANAERNHFYVVGDHDWDAEAAKGTTDKILATGFTDLDIALDGGFTAGDAVLGIAPTGAGKTVVGCQFAGHWALNGSKGVYISTEPSQGPRSLEPRFVSNFCKIPFSRVKRGVRKADLTDKQWEDYQALKTEFKSNLLITQWRGQDGMDIIKDLDRTVETAAEKLGGLDFIVFDWVNNLAAGCASIADAQITRQLYQRAADHLAYSGPKYKCVLVALAQANPAQARNKIQVDQSTIKECKTMGENFPVNFGVTALINFDAAEDGDNIFTDRQYIYLAKLRTGATIAVPFKRRYEYMRMEQFTK